MGGGRKNKWILTKLGVHKEDCIFEAREKMRLGQFLFQMFKGIA